MLTLTSQQLFWHQVRTFHGWYLRTTLLTMFFFMYPLLQFVVFLSDPIALKTGLLKIQKSRSHLQALCDLQKYRPGEGRVRNSKIHFVSEINHPLLKKMHFLRVPVSCAWRCSIQKVYCITFSIKEKSRSTRHVCLSICLPLFVSLCLQKWIQDFSNFFCTSPRGRQTISC